MFRRSEPRASRRSPALITAGEHEVECQVVDISERGARLTAAVPHLPDAFEFRLEQRSIPRLAQVRWMHAGELGIEFVPRRGGDAIPDIQLGLSEGPQRTANLRQLVGSGRTVLVGVVGAFAPERLQIHLNEVYSRAAELHRIGFARLICVAPNDPWTVKAWAGIIDPERRLTYLSDGHLDLARWLGTSFVPARRRHLGPRSRSYLALFRSGTIERLSLDDIASSLSFDERAELGEASPSSDPAGAL